MSWCYVSGHVLGAPDVFVGMRELLNLLFAKSHGRDMKKIINWAKPSKLLDEKQQEEVSYHAHTVFIWGVIWYMMYNVWYGLWCMVMIACAIIFFV